MQICAIGILLTFPATTSAHRLDEYLQATRISLALDRIVVEIDLTPGVDVAPMIFALINTNHDGRISEVEGRTYASQFLKEIVLEVDGQGQRLALIRSQFPSFQELSAGLGTIRIEARALWAGICSFIKTITDPIWALTSQTRSFQQIAISKLQSSAVIHSSAEYDWALT